MLPHFFNHNFLSSFRIIFTDIYKFRKFHNIAKFVETKTKFYTNYITKKNKK